MLYALSLVGGLRTDDLSWAIAALEDEDTRDAAVVALGATDGPLPSVPAGVLSAIARSCTGDFWVDRPRYVSLLDRVPGGIDALLEVLRIRLTDRAEGSASRWEADWGETAKALEVVRLLGPRAAPLRGTLVEGRARIEDDVWKARELDATLAAISADADGTAENLDFMDGPTATALLRLGARGRLAIVLFAGRRPDKIANVLDEVVGDAGMNDAVVAASRPSDDDPHSDVRRAGAVRLASLLPVAEAHAMLVRLASDPSDEVRSAVAEVLDEWAARDPASVPIEALRSLLGDASSAETQLAAAHAAWAMGGKALPLVSALRAAADGRDGAHALMASLAVARITGTTDDAVQRVRAFLARAAVADDSEDEESVPSMVWTAIGDLLATAPLTPADLPTLLPWVGREAFYGPTFAESTAALRGIARLGPAAASTVPVIRSSLGGISHWQATEDSSVEPAYLEWVAAAARALAAIGPAAREAIPDLQRVAAISGDPDGVVRDAIARLR